MKVQVQTKSILAALLITSQVSTAKSFLSSNSVSNINLTPKCKSDRPCSNDLLAPLPAFHRNKLSKHITISRTTFDNILSLRAGAGVFALPSLASLNTFFKQYPYVAAFLICKYPCCTIFHVLDSFQNSWYIIPLENIGGLQASAADLIAQKSSQITSTDNAVDIRGGTNEKGSQPTFEFKRNLAFLFYGGAYQGCFQEHLFNKLFPMIFGEGKGLLTVGMKVTFDMLIVSPFLCLPVAYLIKGAIYRLSFIESIRRYIHDVRQNALLKTYWSVWYPVQIFNFLLIPKQFRISFIACFSFFWLIALSTISGKSEKIVHEAWDNRTRLDWNFGLRTCTINNKKYSSYNRNLIHNS